MTGWVFVFGLVVAAPQAAPYEEGPARPARGPVEQTPFEDGEPEGKPSQKGAPKDEGKSAKEGRLEREPPPIPARTDDIVRISLRFGPVFRVRPVDALLSADTTYGRVQGFSGLFHAGFVPPRSRDRRDDRVIATEGSLGAGAALRGRLENKDLSLSLGLTAGLRIHRAHFDDQTVHRVDPDLRLPIVGAWTIRKVGLSMALVQGYAFRTREYETRGNAAWRRTAYRISVSIGLHLDLLTKRRNRRSRR